MLRGVLTAFVVGWFIWFWIDKHPHALGPLPEPVEGELAANFQVTVDLLKSGRLKAAFVYLWRAHYLIVSLAVGLLLSMIGSAASRSLSRRRLAGLYATRRRKRKSDPAQRADSRGQGSESE